MTDSNSSQGGSTQGGTSQGGASGFGARTGADDAQQRFFGWMRSLGVVRREGWIGGVCGGIAARLGIDPIIVRGIAVVVAVLGGPVFLFYAAAWLLLPDIHGDIHLQRLIAGHFEPAIVGIGVFALITFLPVARGFWWAGGQVWGSGFWPDTVGNVLWSLLVVGGIIALVIWLTRTTRFTSRGGEPGSRTASATPGTPGTSPDQAGGEQPQRPGSDTGSAIDAWKRSQEEWRQQHATWREQQNADQRAVREQRAAENRARAQQFAERANEERRIRRLSRPRTSGPYIGATFGVALLAGAISGAIARADAGLAGYAWTVALAVATLVFGLAIALAGALRRRSGFLTFMSILLILMTLGSVATPRSGSLSFPAISMQSVSENRHLVQPVGSYSLYLADGSVIGGPHTIRLDQGAGSVSIYIAQGVDARIETTQPRGTSSTLTARTVSANGDRMQHPSSHPVGNGRVETTLAYGDTSHPDVTVAVSQWAGSVNVVYDTSGATSSR